ncbi:hypothetical protein BTVI_74380 [Pitangus sulphuratus]|nr:hypothetical protein BTVI_74380 [Pitangus sulphuratus]
MDEELAGGVETSNTWTLKGLYYDQNLNYSNDSGIKCSLIKFADDAKLSGAVVLNMTCISLLKPEDCNYTGRTKTRGHRYKD